ncbi:MAG: PorT family protein [Mucilaginibacter polytrichastri]|nr:PorT family protein [Mucilaginibacter polytrichastri]
MKKLFLTLMITGCAAIFAKAQVLPSIQFGVKAGANLSSFSKQNTFSSDNRAGYLGGFWARFGAAGINFQPELYLTGKYTKLSDGAGNVNEVKFTSIDVPLLVGYRIGALGVAARLNTGPLASFVIDKNQSLGSAASNAVRLNTKNQAFAWQFGVGADIQKLTVDLRYELGLTKLNTESYGSTRINMFNLSLGYRIW